MSATKIDKLVRALLPFAAVANICDAKEDDSLIMWEDRSETETRTITLGHCRAALDAVKTARDLVTWNRPPLKALGEKQFAVLGGLIAHQGMWHDGCGWIVDTSSETVRILEALTKRGMVVSRPTKFIGPKGEYFKTTYKITPAGRKIARKS